MTYSDKGRADSQFLHETAGATHSDKSDQMLSQANSQLRLIGFPGRGFRSVCNPRCLTSVTTMIGLSRSLSNKEPLSDLPVLLQNFYIEEPRSDLLILQLIYSNGNYLRYHVTPLNNAMQCNLYH